MAEKTGQTNADGPVLKLKWIAGWVFRIYIVALFAGIAALGLFWTTGELSDNAAVIGRLWYGIAGLGAITLVFLLTIRLLTERTTQERAPNVGE